MGKDVQQLIFSYITGLKGKMVQQLWKTVQQFHIKLNIYYMTQKFYSELFPSPWK